LLPALCVGSVVCDCGFQRVDRRDHLCVAETVRTSDDEGHGAEKLAVLAKAIN
jgi:hypothetical protein